MKLQNAVFWTIVAASLTATALVAVDALDDSRRVGHRQFQNLLGGLGMGSHTELSRCPWLFDPRVAGDDHAVPGCPPGNPGGCDWHSMSIFPAPNPVAPQE